MIEMVSLGGSESNLHLCFVFDGPFSLMLLHIEYGSDKKKKFIPKYGQIGLLFLKIAKKYCQNMDFFYFFL